MSDPAIPVPAPAATPADEKLSQWQRLVYIFLSPRRTFTDILRNASWWLPFLLTVVVTYGFCYAVERRVTWQKVANNSIKQNTVAADRFANMDPAKATATKAEIAAYFRYFSYASPLLNLLIAAIISAVLLATVNFIFAGQAKFKQMLALYFYATFPLNVKYLLAIIVLLAGINPDQFQLKNPVGTDLGYYLSSDSAPWLMALGSQISIFALWILILLSQGCAVIGRIKPRQAAKAVVGWWAFFVLFLVIWTAVAG